MLHYCCENDYSVMHFYLDLIYSRLYTVSCKCSNFKCYREFCLRGPRVEINLGRACEGSVRPRKGPRVSRKLGNTGLGGRNMIADEMKLYEITHCFGLKQYRVQFWREKQPCRFFILPRHLRLCHEALYVRLPMFLVRAWHMDAPSGK
jgi:hypothetical protein